MKTLEITGTRHCMTPLPCTHPSTQPQRPTGVGGSSDVLVETGIWAPLLRRRARLQMSLGKPHKTGNAEQTRRLAALTVELGEEEEEEEKEE